MFFYDLPVVDSVQARMKRMSRRLKACVPWDPAMKWEPELNIKASTYKVLNLFQNLGSTRDVEQRPYAESANKRWRYINLLLPVGKDLLTHCGHQKGTVVFDDDIAIPALYDKEMYEWERAPFMSITPMEILTLRCGNRFAKGRTIIAGLGLGHQLIEVSKRKQVKEIVLVEKSEELVEWLWPKIFPHVQKPIKVIIGDAYEVMPGLRADSALVDIFPGYGCNDYEREKLQKACKNIGQIWCWGAYAPKSSRW